MDETDSSPVTSTTTPNPSIILTNTTFPKRPYPLFTCLWTPKSDTKSESILLGGGSGTNGTGFEDGLFIGEMIPSLDPTKSTTTINNSITSIAKYAIITNIIAKYAAIRDIESQLKLHTFFPSKDIVNGMIMHPKDESIVLLAIGHRVIRCHWKKKDDSSSSLSSSELSYDTCLFEETVGKTRKVENKNIVSKDVSSSSDSDAGVNRVMDATYPYQIYTVSISPDGSYLMASNEVGMVYTWHYPTMKSIDIDWKLKKKSAVNSISFTIPHDHINPPSQSEFSLV